MQDKKVQDLPLVSIIIPSFNHEKFVGATIESVLEQTYPCIELIVIDDGSSDDTLKVVRKYEQSSHGMRVIAQENQGLSQTLNNALKHAHGEYVAFIASDDVMHPEKTEKQVAFLDAHPEYAVVAGGYQRIDAEGNLIDADIRGPKTAQELTRDVLSGCVYHAPTATYRASALCSVGGFKPGIVNEDWYIQIMLRNFGFRFYHLPGVCAFYRIHEANTHTDIEASLRHKKKLAAYFNVTESKKIIRSSYRHAMSLSKEYHGAHGLLKFMARHITYLVVTGLFFEPAKQYAYKTYKRVRALQGS